MFGPLDENIFPGATFPEILATWVANELFPGMQVYLLHSRIE